MDQTGTRLVPNRPKFSQTAKSVPFLRLCRSDEGCCFGSGNNNTPLGRDAVNCAQKKNLEDHSAGCVPECPPLPTASQERWAVGWCGEYADCGRVFQVHIFSCSGVTSTPLGGAVNCAQSAYPKCSLFPTGDWCIQQQHECCTPEQTMLYVNGCVVRGPVGMPQPMQPIKK